MRPDSWNPRATLFPGILHCVLHRSKGAGIEIPA